MHRASQEGMGDSPSETRDCSWIAIRLKKEADKVSSGLRQPGAIDLQNI